MFDLVETETRMDGARPPACPSVLYRTGGGGFQMPDAQAVSEQTTWLIAVRDHKDRAAFSALFDFYGPRLKAMLIRAGTRGDRADDIVQDVMLTVWRKSDQFDPARAPASAWIYRIARNRHVDILRKENRPVPEELHLADSHQDDADLSLALQQEAARLKSALAALSPDQREMIEKAYLGDLTHEDIRRQTGLPLGTVKSRIRLGLERLRHELKGLRH